MTEREPEREPEDDADRDAEIEDEPDAGPWAKTSGGDAESPGGD
jgi:hypothetical protein